MRLYLALFNHIYFTMHFKISFWVFWEPQKPQATLTLSRKSLGLNAAALSGALDLVLRAAALVLLSHFLALMSCLVPRGTKQQANFVSAKYSALQSPVCCLFGFGTLSFPLPFKFILLTF